MYRYAGIDMSLECSSVCLVDGTGKILRETKVVSEPEALIGWFRSLGLMLERAKVALARKLAVILHRMLADAKPFNPAAKAAAI
jgi:hypothetical protein